MTLSEEDTTGVSSLGGRLPNGFAVQIDRNVRFLNSGAALLGGSPTRLLRLAPAAQVLLSDGRLEVRDASSAQLARTLLDATVAHPRPVSGPGYRDVTVVIPCYNNGFGLRRLLRSLRGLRVIVVDDGSAIPIIARELDDVHIDVQVIRHDQCRGPAAARNTGLRLATTDFVAFLDSDVVPRRGWLETLLGHFSDPSVALVAPRIIGLMMSDNIIARYEARRSSMDLGLREAPVVPYGPVSHVPSAAIVARRSAMEAIEGFDESLRCGEDVDLCWRLIEAGLRLRYEPVSHVAHDHRLALREWLQRKAFCGTSAAPLSRRHPDKVAPMVISPWTFLVWVLAALGSGLGYLAAAVVAALVTGRVARSLKGLDTPRRDVARIAAQGVLSAALQIAAALCRHYWPLGLIAAMLSRRSRQVLLTAAILDGVVDWVRRHDSSAAPSDRIGLVEYILLKRLDDIAYGIGLWSGILRERDFGPLRPEVRP